MRPVTIFILVVGALSKDPPHYNIDENVDEILPRINRYMKSNSFLNVTLADLSDQSAPVFIGVSFGNLDTIVRSGEAEMWAADENTLAVKVN